MDSGALRLTICAMFVVTRDTIVGRAPLDMRSLPRKFLGRVLVIPRAGAGWGVIWRLVFEMQMLRYFVALAPFLVAMLVWPHLALPIAQAPLAMILFIALIETKLLTYTPEARKALLPEAEAGRILDTLTFRARGLLPAIAARHGIEAGRLHLVVEQSEIARIAPLTLVSVQAEDPPRILDLSQTDRAEIGTLFDAELTEKMLHKVNARDRSYIRDIALEARSVSAHTRMAARIKARKAVA